MMNGFYVPNKKYKFGDLKSPGNFNLFLVRLEVKRWIFKIIIIKGRISKKTILR